MRRQTTCAFFRGRQPSLDNYLWIAYFVTFIILSAVYSQNRGNEKAVNILNCFLASGKQKMVCVSNWSKVVSSSPCTITGRLFAKKFHGLRNMKLHGLRNMKFHGLRNMKLHGLRNMKLHGLRNMKFHGLSDSGRRSGKCRQTGRQRNCSCWSRQQIEMVHMGSMGTLVSLNSVKRKLNPCCDNSTVDLEMARYQLQSV